jgi:hypothetical protein
MQLLGMEIWIYIGRSPYLFIEIYEINILTKDSVSVVNSPLYLNNNKYNRISILHYIITDVSFDKNDIKKYLGFIIICSKILKILQLNKN